MQAEAINQAEDHLQRAHDSHERLERATTYSEIRRAWSDFLSASSTIYNKLEQGAKGNDTSQKWYATIKQMRRSDGLLSYVHHARNANEHALLSTVIPSASRRVYIDNPDIYPNARYLTGHGPEDLMSKKDFKFEMTHTETGRKHPVYIQAPERYLAVAPAKDRGVVYAVPTDHLGETIEVNEPLGIATIALSYLEDLVAEARELPIMPSKQSY